MKKLSVFFAVFSIALIAEKSNAQNSFQIDSQPTIEQLGNRQELLMFPGASDFVKREEHYPLIWQKYSQTEQRSQCTSLFSPCLSDLNARQFNLAGYAKYQPLNLLPPLQQKYTLEKTLLPDPHRWNCIDGYYYPGQY